MKIGTKTLFFGCHQFIIHPLYVYIAWIKLYHKLPSIGETLAIIIHDWGYFGKGDLDGIDGEKHPEWACKFFNNIKHLWFTQNWFVKCLDLSDLCLYHSRSYAKIYNAEPSKLCWADKYGTILYGKYLWTFLATISGELNEYKTNDMYKVKEQESYNIWSWHKHGSKVLLESFPTNIKARVRK